MFESALTRVKESHSGERLASDHTEWRVRGIVGSLRRESRSAIHEGF
jgi:hypothetical protein